MHAWRTGSIHEKLCLFEIFRWKLAIWIVLAGPTRDPALDWQ